VKFRTIFPAFIVYVVVWTLVASTSIAMLKQIKAKFLYAEDGTATFQTETGEYIISPIEVGSFTEKYIKSPGFKNNKQYLLTYVEGTWKQEVLGTTELVNVQRLTDAKLLNEEAGFRASSEQLLGLWETANTMQPFDINSPALTLKFLEDGSLITDEDTNRETRGTWKLEGRVIHVNSSGSRYSNRIVDFDSAGGTMILKYEMYDNMPLKMHQAGRFD
jgi:hypothetical protein